MAKAKKEKVNHAWIWQDDLFDGKIDEWYGFIYMIRDHERNKYYVGEKSFWSFKVPKGKINKVKSESEWRRYPSSNAELSCRVKSSGELCNEKYSFEILALCKDKSVMHFEEAYWIFNKNCLVTDNCYNDNVKINRIGSIANYSERVLRSTTCNTIELMK